MEKLTRNIEVKKQFTDEQKIEILKQISDADALIAGKNLDLVTLKEQTAAIKESIEQQYDIMSTLCANYRRGYVSRIVECEARYIDGEATFTDIKTGEIVEQRPITEAEQLQLNGNRVDAEDIIRQDND